MNKDNINGNNEKMCLPVLALVAPCYNEHEVVLDSFATMRAKLAAWIEQGLIDNKSFCCFVDDGSEDDTWNLLVTALTPPHEAVKLSFNAGHQCAVYAGLRHVSDNADCSVSLDVDLQDDMDAIPEMLAAFANGADVVYGVRDKRPDDSFFKRNSAAAFYWLSNKLGVPGHENHADFRLLSKKAMRVLGGFKEHHLYLRGLIPSLKMPAAIVRYTRKQRIAGTSKYPAAKMLLLAFDGITSFSIVPLRLITVLGFIISMLSLLLGLYFLAGYFFSDGAITGWTSLIVSLYFLGGLIMFALGIVGEYIGKIFIESKKRPLYMIDNAIHGRDGGDK